MDNRQKEVSIANMLDNPPMRRKKLNMTQANSAAKIGIGRSLLTMIENKKRPIT